MVKNLPAAAKLEIIAKAYEVTKPVTGQTVVLVDDLLDSGATLNILGGLLRGAGAERVVGLAMTKTREPLG